MSDLIITLFDVVNYLNDKGISFNSDRMERGWIGIPCLWCSDTGEHLGINVNSNIVSCWKCGEKGSITKLVKEMDHTVTYPETLEIMEKYQDFSRLSLIKDDEELTPKLNLKIPSFLEKLIWPDVPNIVNQFLHKRGFDPETICRGKTLYYGGHVGKFKFRLILPVTLRGRLISWIGRDLTGKSSISYLNLEEEKSALPIKNTLYGFDEAPPGGNIVVVEGPMDQWKLGPGAVATYGTAWTQPQVTLLRKLNPNSIFILFDSEATAQKSAKKLSEQIWWCNCEVVMLNNANDPGELTVEQGKELMTSLQ